MELHREREALAGATGRRVPLVVKVSPDLDEDNLRAVAVAVLEAGMGVIATNTTITRPAGFTPSFADEAGGLSGTPLAPLATAAVATLRDALGPGFPIIGAGGIRGPETARAMLDAGADLLPSLHGACLRGAGADPYPAPVFLSAGHRFDFGDHCPPIAPCRLLSLPRQAVNRGPLAPLSTSVNAALVNCAPWSVLKISGRPWCARASSRASTQKSLSGVLDSRHASTAAVPVHTWRRLPA